MTLASTLLGDDLISGRCGEAAPATLRGTGNFLASSLGVVVFPSGVAEGGGQQDIRPSLLSGENAGYSKNNSVCYAASLSTLYLQDELLPDQTPAFKHLTPKGLFISFVRQSVLVLGARMQVVTKRIDELEDDEEDELSLSDIFSPAKHRHEFSMWRGFLPCLKLGMVREALVTTFQRTYELVAIQSLRRELASRLVKDIAKSSTRKAARYAAQKMTLSIKVARTALLGNVTFYAASFTVSQLIDTWETAKASVDDDDPAARAFAQAKRSGYLRRLANNAVRCTGMCVFAAFGAAVGTHIKPGLGTTLGVIFAPNVFLLLC